MEDAQVIETSIDKLKKAYQRGSLALYLGAGVSVDSGLPTWERLVLSMYFQTNQDIFNETRSQPFPNYLFAISEWLLKESSEPLDIITSRIKRHYRDRSPEEFYRLLKETLYSAYMEMGQTYNRSEYDLFRRNSTLEAVVKLCAGSVPGNTGVKTIISYNYDDLVERGLQLFDPAAEEKYKTIYHDEMRFDSSQIPIYHVHGYIPYDESPGSSLDDLIFSEESYHKAAQNAYYWGNMVQMQNLANNTGLMVGLSLSDRNIRRILNALISAPIATENYIIIKREKPEVPTSGEPAMDFIHNKAGKYLDKFSEAAMKTIGGKADQFISRIIEIIMRNDEGMYQEDFGELGLHLIPVDDYSRIGEIINDIHSN
jgi:hypothetical protein